MKTVEKEASPLRQTITQTLTTLDGFKNQLGGLEGRESIAALVKETRANVLRADPTLILLFPPPPSSASRGLNGQVKEILLMQSSPESLTATNENALQTTPDTVPDSDSEHRKIRPQRKTGINNGVAENNIDDEEPEDLDALDLHLKDIKQIPIQIENHQRWAEEISAGRIALQALSILSQSELLSPSQKERVSMALEKGRFLLSRLHLRIKEVTEKLQKNNYRDDQNQAARLRELDMEFLQTVSGNEELVNEILGTAKGIEDEDERETMLQRFIEHQINLASQGKQSWNNLTEHNLRLSVTSAKKYQGRGIPLDDLIQYGHEGLMIAAAEYDPRRDSQFSTYAYWWITQQMRKGIDNNGSMVRLPIYVRNEIRKNTAQINGKVVMPYNLFVALKTQNVSSLDRPIDEKGTTILDIVANPQAEDPQIALDETLTKETVKKVLAGLDPRDRKVIDLRFGLIDGDGRSRTLEEIGQELGVTRERARQLEEKALRKLRHPSRSQKLRHLFER